MYGAKETPNDKLPAVFYGEGAKPRSKHGTVHEPSGFSVLTRLLTTWGLVGFHL